MTTEPRSSNRPVSPDESSGAASLGFRIDDYPEPFIVADGTSKRARRTLFWLARLELALVVVFASLAALAGHAPGLPGALRFLPAVVLLVAIAAKATRHLRGYDRLWFDGRVVSETAKSATWRYMMQSPPYGGATSLADDVLSRTLQETVAARPSLALPHYHLTADHDRVITPRMRQVRELPFEERRRLYLAARIADQMAWYTEKSRDNGRSSAIWFWTSMIAFGLALVAAIVMAVASLPIDPTGLLVAVGLASIAWAQTECHSERQHSYLLAALELEALRLPLSGADQEQAFRTRVADTETAISREHTMWMAKRQ